MAYTPKAGGALASFEGRYPKDLFNKSVVARGNQTLIGHVAKETNELIMIFSESDRKVRFDVPKSEITFTGSSVVIDNTKDIQKYKVYRDTPLPQDNNDLIPTVTAQEYVHQILSDESSIGNTREKESSATSTKLLLQQTSIRKEGKEEATAKLPVKTTTKAIPRSNYTINKVQQEKSQQPGPITATTTDELLKQSSIATTLQEDQSLTNKKEEAIAISKEEAIRPKVLTVHSEPATNEISGPRDKPLDQRRGQDLTCLIFIININNTIIGDNTNKCIGRRTIRENSSRKSCGNSGRKSCFKGGSRNSNISTAGI